MPGSQQPDAALEDVAAKLQALDPQGRLTAQVLRDTLDQLYDGQRTRRYRWDQLFKTEKTHCGTLVEINLQRQFEFSDGNTLDYQIAGHEVDCKYSQHLTTQAVTPSSGFLTTPLCRQMPSFNSTAGQWTELWLSSRA
jgi:hypothetical protein